MVWRMSKRIKILPGVKLNLSKTGVSASVGRPGASINVSNRGTKATLGIPGTGISHSRTIERASRQADPADQPAGVEVPLHMIALRVVWNFCAWALVGYFGALVAFLVLGISRPEAPIYYLLAAIAVGGLKAKRTFDSLWH
jgi:hypothetical protein